MADKSPGSSLIPLPIRSSKKQPSGSPTSVQTIQKIYEEESIEDDSDNDKIELRKSSSLRSRISKSEYLKLQRKSTTSGERIEKLKEKYQNKRPKSEGSLNIGREVNIDQAIKQADKTDKRGSLKVKISSPAKSDQVTELKTQTSINSESPKTEKKVSFTDVLVNHKEPIPKPRKSLENLKKIDEYERDNPFISNNESSAIYENIKQKSPSSPSKKDGKAKEVRVTKVQFNTIQFADPEPRHVIVRQESVDSLNLIQQGLDNFEMDDKKFGRRSSFKGLKNFFTSKTKKKEEETKAKKNQNVIVGENYENENFTRGSPMRHTVDSTYHKNFQQNPGYYNQKGSKDTNVASQADIENNFAQMHLEKYNKVKERFANGGSVQKSPEDYVCMDNASNFREREPSHNGSLISDITKNHDTCSSNTDSENTSSTYENALIAQAEMLQRKNQRQKPIPPKRDYSNRNKYMSGNQSDQSSDRRTDTPPRAQETYQNFELIKPRASIPINSERPLPNPYANTSEESLPTNKTIDRNLNKDSSSKFSPIITNTKGVLVNEIYGTVYDAKPQISRQSSIGGAASPTNFGHKSPAKLRLPANREKVELVPRMKSPIPPAVVSTDKIIATELLKNKKGPKDDKTNVSTHQNLSIEIDYPPDNYYNTNGNSTTVSPRLNRPLEPSEVPRSPLLQKPQNNIINRTEMVPSESTPNNQIATTTNVMVDVHATNYQPMQIMPQQISPYYSLQDRRSSLSLSPTKRFSPSPLTRSPSKQEIRQSVEAFCWKEIKKLKDKQDEQLYGYVQHPGRPSRSLSVSDDRGRRSLSLPREMPKARRNLDLYQHQHSLQMPMPQEPIYGVTQNGQYFVRNSPQRRTIESMHKSSGQLHSGPTTKPIFNRGSLQQQVHAYNPANNIDYNKKVSFINTQTIQQSWPTKNGYMQSPPQRKLDTMQRMESMEDEVFLPMQQNNLRANNSRPPSASNQNHQQQQIEHQRRMYEQHLQQQQEATYGRLDPQQQQQQHVRRLTLEEMHYLKQQQINQEPIYGRRHVAESLYGRTQAPVVFDQHMGYSKDSLQQMQRRKLLEDQNHQEPIYGVRYGTPIPRSTMDGPSRMHRPILPPPVNTDYGGYMRQVRVNDKECDIYGQIHEKNQQALRNAQMQQSGIMYGQLQRNVNAGPMQHQSYNQLMSGGQQNFVRNSRLTASANDMHRNISPQYHHQRHRNNEVILHEEPMYGQRQSPVGYYNSSSGAPMRPLPPVPNNNTQGKNTARMLHRADSLNESANREYNQQLQHQQQQQSQRQEDSKKGSSKKTKVKSGK